MRLIDADALVETLETLQRNADKCIPVERGIWMGFNYALAEIKGSTTVDMRIVRCEQCRYWGKDGFGDYRKCSIDGAWHKPSFYCASGERKDDGKNRKDDL